MLMIPSDSNKIRKILQNKSGFVWPYSISSWCGCQKYTMQFQRCYWTSGVTKVMPFTLIAPVVHKFA